VLAFVAAQYRLQGISVNLFPRDPRQGKRAKARTDCRPGESVTARELGQFLLTVALWAAAGQIVIRLLPREAGYLGLRPIENQVLLWTWLVGGAWVVRRSGMPRPGR